LNGSPQGNIHGNGSGKTTPIDVVNRQRQARSRYATIKNKQQQQSQQKPDRQDFSSQTTSGSAKRIQQSPESTGAGET
jgi:hypothetical protein